MQAMKSSERHFFHYTERTYHCIKKLMDYVGRSCAMPPLLDTENDMLCVDDIDKCNLLNSFFCSISKDWELQGPKSAPPQMSITFSPKCIFTICAFQK